MKNLTASDCHFTPSQQEVIDLGLSDWNPFCENNRDAGATGKDQCDGVKKLNNPLHSNGPVSTNGRTLINRLRFKHTVKKVYLNGVFRYPDEGKLRR